MIPIEQVTPGWYWAYYKTSDDSLSGKLFPIKIVYPNNCIKVESNWSSDINHFELHSRIPEPPESLGKEWTPICMDCGEPCASCIAEKEGPPEADADVCGNCEGSKTAIIYNSEGCPVATICPDCKGTGKRTEVDSE